MRPLEILTPILLAIYLIWPLTGRKRPPAIGVLPAFVLVVIAAHANIEGMRWQMVPLYGFAVVTFFMSIPDFMKARRGMYKQGIRCAPLPASYCSPFRLRYPSCCLYRPSRHQTDPTRSERRSMN